MNWTLHLEEGPQKVNHAAVAVGEKIYTFGGYCSTLGLELPWEIDINVFNTATLRWRPVHHTIALPYRSSKCVPKMVYGHTVVAYENKVYLFGGRTNNRSYNKLYCFDLDSQVWSTPVTSGFPPPQMDGHSACVIGHHMYIFGGFEENLETFSQKTHRINLLTYDWEEVYTQGEPPVPSDFHTASAIGDCMYIFGGRSTRNALSFDVDHDIYCNNIKYLDTSTNRWFTPQCKGNIPQGRRSHSAVVYKDEIYIIGGFHSLSNTHFMDVHKFNPDENEWSKIKVQGKYPPTRRRHCACIVDDSLYLFGGSRPADVQTGKNGELELIELSDMHILDFAPSLKRLCQVSVIKFMIDYSQLPSVLRMELGTITRNCA